MSASTNYSKVVTVSNSQQQGSTTSEPGFASLVSGFSVASLGAATVYLAGPGANKLSTEGPVAMATRACTIQNLYACCATAPGGSDTAAFTVDVSTDNGATWSATTLTCTITGTAKSASDVAHRVAVAAGNLLSIKVISSGATAAAVSATFEVA